MDDCSPTRWKINSYPKQRSSSLSGGLFISDEKMECEMDTNCCDEKGTKPEGKAFDLPIDRHSDPYLWSWALGGD